MQTFNNYSIRFILEAIETGNIDTAIDLTSKGLKTKPFYLAAKVGQITAQYTLDNNKNDVQMDRLVEYLRKLNNMQMLYSNC